MNKAMEICKLCGNPLNLEDFDLNHELPRYMAENRVCFKCAFWEDRIFQDTKLFCQGKIALITPNYDHWISKIEGEQLGITSPGMTFTSLNPTYRILVIDHLEKKFFFILTNNISHQGNIPSHLRGLYRVNARILTPEEYQLLRDQSQLTYLFVKNIVENGF